MTETRDEIERRLAEMERQALNCSTAPLRLFQIFQQAVDTIRALLPALDVAEAAVAKENQQMVLGNLNAIQPLREYDAAHRRFHELRDAHDAALARYVAAEGKGEPA